MANYPHLPPPPERRRIPRQYSLRAMFLLTTLVALGVSMFLEGGLFVIVGMLVAMLALVGLAIALSKLPSPLAGAVCVATLIGLAVATIAVSENLYEVREDIHNLLGQLSTKGDIDMVVFWLCVLATSLGLGSMLGYGIALSRERN